MSENFNSYFISKIDKIREGFSDDTDCYEYGNPAPPGHFTSFHEVKEEHIVKIISQSKNKQCSLDPIPTTLVKQCSDILAPAITEMINKSLLGAEVPTIFKEAVVTPLLKKTTLDPVSKNYRPVSNLC